MFGTVLQQLVYVTFLQQWRMFCCTDVCLFLFLDWFDYYHKRIAPWSVCGKTPLLVVLVQLVCSVTECDCCVHICLNEAVYRGKTFGFGKKIIWC